MIPQAQVMINSIKSLGRYQWVGIGISCDWAHKTVKHNGEPESQDIRVVDVSSNPFPLKTKIASN